MSQAVAKPVDQLPLAPAASESAAILSVIERMAVNPEIDPDRIERFIALKERIDAGNAKLAFSQAIADAKAQIAATPIFKNRKGHNDKAYADFSAYAKVVDPILSGLGLTYRFRTVQGERISVTCILTGHGHEEENTLAGPADNTGSKNAIQAIGSTLTYLQRYTLVQALGLAASDDDDGAAAGAAETISDEQRDALLQLASEVGADLPKFCSYFKIGAVGELPVAKLAQATQLLESKRRAK
jgi:hypothetical protein